MKSTTAVISLMFIVAFLHSCYTRMCYQCRFDKRECGKTVNNYTYSGNCPDDNQCTSFVLNMSDTYDIVRMCEPKGIVSYTWDQCNSDTCNGKKGKLTSHYNGSLIQCYICSSKPNKSRPQCENIDDDTYLEVCRIGEVCYTMMGLDSDNNLISIERGCSKKGVELISQRHCDRDNCNGKML